MCSVVCVCVCVCVVCVCVCACVCVCVVCILTHTHSLLLSHSATHSHRRAQSHTAREAGEAGPGGRLVMALLLSHLGCAAEVGSCSEHRAPAMGRLLLQAPCVPTKQTPTPCRAWRCARCSGQHRARPDVNHKRLICAVQPANRVIHVQNAICRTGRGRSAM